MSTNDDSLVIKRKITGTPQIETPKRSDQLGVAEFLVEIDTLLAIEGVMAVRWTQFTPYFNDGDECVFGAGEPEVLLGGKFGASAVWRGQYSLYTRDPEAGPAPDWRGLDGYRVYRDWDEMSRLYAINGQPTREVEEALKNFSARMTSFYDVLYKNFGDHATVTASTDGFEIEFYDHD
ncbi:hypothetical protein QEH42_gp056 [Microbacterium phage Pumpernickel]|uniref:Uncharacterized protein n=1 Tax=Microbacterium phage Pumpernickel TaxID=2885983 RepID=A0AAE8Y7K2_9CAUD|nr:hypothetical protein QEH42_gp056 [Microbacterium phage Pumpernickel]UDL15847.1 hypothetical protein SEA_PUMPERNICKEL_56 [Microbacterium phage Pumpernickel]